MDPEAGLLVVADGMGGYNAGHQASRLAVDTVSRVVRTASAMEHPGRLLRDAVERANTVIHESAQDNPAQEGMGTTIVTSLIRGGRITVAHVGDSRLYRLRRNQLELLTRDHSLNQELLEQGYYTETEARRADNQHVVTRALGVREAVEVSLREETVAEGDLFLLCSDGLTDMVDEHSIRYTLELHRDNPEASVDQLIKRANQLGGRDNVAVIVARSENSQSPRLGLGGRLRRWLGRG